VIRAFIARLLGVTPPGHLAMAREATLAVLRRRREAGIPVPHYSDEAGNRALDDEIRAEYDRIARKTAAP
jgi:hypothetical protein